MCDAVLDQFPIRISVDHMMDSCLVSKWLRFNSKHEAHIHTCSWHREGERANTSNIKALGLQRNEKFVTYHSTVRVAMLDKISSAQEQLEFLKNRISQPDQVTVPVLHQSFWYVHFGTSPLLDSSAVSSFRNQPASKYHFTAWPACFCMLVLTHKAVSIPGLLVMP